METWHAVHVAASSHEWQVFDRASRLPQAATPRSIELGFNLRAVDRIELTFSKPVVTNPHGERVSPDAINPGYSEIKLEWAE